MVLNMEMGQTTFSAVLGVVLSNLRAERGIEQADMAGRMGLSQASYSRLESGKSTFTVDQMYQAAAALDLNGDQLTERLNQMVRVLELNSARVIPQMRANTTRARSENSGAGSFVVGAALAALLIGLLSKK